MTIALPFDQHRETIQPEWIDVNGHMNVGYYGLVFDHAVDILFDFLGVGFDYIAATQRSVFQLETRTQFHQELTLGQPIRTKTHLIDFDQKRMHYWHQMEHAEEGWVAARMEAVSIHVDLKTRKSAPFPGDALVVLGRMQIAHEDLPRPEDFERTLGIRREA
jgi:acyl-CoA thioester hydrolase